MGCGASAQPQSYPGADTAETNGDPGADTAEVKDQVLSPHSASDELSIIKVANAFLQHCERGTGWNNCQTLCKPGATFSLQATDELEGPPCTSCEQYAEFMKGCVEQRGGEASFEVHAVADAETSVVLFCTSGGFSHCAFCVRIEEDKVADVVKVWNDSYVSPRALSSPNAMGSPKASPTKQRGAASPTKQRGADWRGNISSIQHNALTSFTPSMANIQRHLRANAPFREAPATGGKKRPAKASSKEVAISLAQAFVRSCETGAGWTTACKEMCTSRATYEHQSTVPIPGESKCTNCEQYAESMKCRVEQRGGEASFEVHAAAFDVCISSVVLFCTSGGSQCAFCVRIGDDKVADVVKVWNDGYVVSEQTGSVSVEQSVPPAAEASAAIGEGTSAAAPQEAAPQEAVMVAG